MTDAVEPLTLADYPLAEKRPDLVRSLSGKAMADVTLEAVLAGDVTIDDLRIDAAALRRQAEIARAAGRPTLALNFERGADLVAVPQDVIMRAYDLLRPGRAKAKADLMALASEFRVELRRKRLSPPSSKRQRRSMRSAASSSSVSEIGYELEDLVPLHLLRGRTRAG